MFLGVRERIDKHERGIRFQRGEKWLPQESCERVEKDVSGGVAMVQFFVVHQEKDRETELLLNDRIPNLRPSSRGTYRKYEKKNSGL